MRNFIVFFLIIMVISFVTPNLFIRDVLSLPIFFSVEKKAIFVF